MEELTPEELAELSMAPVETDPTRLDQAELQELQELQSMIVDMNTGDEKPMQVTGVDPSSPANEPVLSVADRAALALGNDVGRVKYLKENYEDAAINDSGDLVVKVAGKWNYADPRGYGQKDPWELSKEILNDTISDQVGVAMIAGTSMLGASQGQKGGGAKGAFGGAVVGATLGEYMRSSLGRIVGTYSADPVEQTRDIALETLYTAAGEKFLPGARVGAKQVIRALEKTGANKLGKQGLNAVWDFYGSMATSPEVVRTFREHPEQVIGLMKKHSRMFQLPAEFIENVTSDKIQTVARLGNEAPKMLSKAYSKFRDGIIEATPDNFAGNSNQYAAAAYADFLEKGSSFLSLQGKRVTDPKVMADTLQYIKKNKRLPRGAEVTFKSQREIQQLVNSGLPVDDAFRRAAVNEDAYRALREAHDSFRPFSGRPSFRMRGNQVLAGRGKGEAHRLLEDQKSLKSGLYSIANDQKLASMGDVTKYINGLRKQVDDQTAANFAEYGMGDQYKKMNAVYSEYKDLLQPLESARKQAGKQGIKAYESLMNQLASKPGKNIARKESVDNLIQLANELKDGAAVKTLNQAKVSLQAADAAIALNPYVTKRSAAMGMTAYAIFSANAALGASMALVTAATNPGLQRNILSLNHASWKALQNVKGMTKQQLQFIQDNPGAASSLARGVMNGKETYEGVKELFDRRFPPAPLRGESDE